MNETVSSSHPEDDDLRAAGDPGAGQSRDSFDECLAELDREFETSATREPEPPHTPEETARHQGNAACRNGRICIDWEKSLISPVHVECAKADSGLIRAICVTRPWINRAKPRRFTLE